MSAIPFRTVDETDGCVPCTCGRCTVARDEMSGHRTRVEEALAKLLDSKRADDLHTHPLTRALIDEQKSKQRLAGAIAEYLAGKANREALAFTLVNELGAS